MSGSHTPQWNAIFRARGDASARAALDVLCRTYRFPVFIYIRRHGYSADAAEDLTQRFFTRLLEHGCPIEVGATRGRLRAILLTAAKRFLINVEQEGRAIKRGGRLHFQSIDGGSAPFGEIVAPDETPERAFEREWARTLLQTALLRLRNEAVLAGKTQLFDRVRDFLVEPPGHNEYAIAAAALQLRRNTLAVAVHRLRRRLCELVREEIAVTTPGDDLERELHELGAALEPGVRASRRPWVAPRVRIDALPHDCHDNVSAVHARTEPGHSAAGILAGHLLHGYGGPAMLDNIKKDAQTRMQKSVDSLRQELTRLRTGRANTALIEPLKVSYYGTDTPITQVANVAIADARSIVITPFEKTLVGPIEKAILASDLGLNPTTVGTVIRINLPPLTEERRKDLSKHVAHEGENAKVAVRNVRRDALQQAKELLKEKQISEDDERRVEDEIQKFTDKYVKDVDAVVKAKEDELMAM